MTMFEVEQEFDWAGRCAHEVPERALEYGAYVCPDVKCQEALAVAVTQNRNLMLCIKWGLGARTPIRAEQFVLLTDGGQDITAVARFLGRDVEPYTDSYEDENGELVEFTACQYVREIFVIEP